MPSVNFNNNTFRGAINNKKAYDYYNKLRNVKYGTAEERIELINEILGIEEIDGVQFADDFWTKVFLQNDEDEYEGGIKLILNTSDNLYTDSNLASTLELAGTMIIKGEKKKDNPDAYIRVFHSREMFQKELNEHEKFRNVVNSTNDGKHALSTGHNDMFILANQMNYKFEKKWTELDDKHLEKLDKEFRDKYPIVHEYYVAYTSLKQKLKDTVAKTDMQHATYEEKRIIKLMTKHVRSLKEDFVDVIYKKMRPIVFKMPLPDKGEPEYDLFDETDKEHVKAALRVTRGNDMQDDLSVILRDIDNTIKECNLNDKQKEIIQLLKTDMTITDIANTIGTDPGSLDKHINVIVKMIIEKNYEKIEDWYYLNISKGKYKRCNECNEVKLISKFNKEPKGAMGVKSKCKQCQKK